MTRLAIIGGGAWGTALAAVARAGGADTVLWARNADVVADINTRHENRLYLPGVPLDPAIVATTDMAAVADADLALLVCPAQSLRDVVTAGRAHLAGKPLAIAAKGIEIATSALMSDVVADVLPEAPLAVVSGPTFADEVARGLPTAVSVAAADIAVARRFAAALARPAFRPYVSDDVVGVEIGGALKNVIAIAAGIVTGRGLGENARAALITRGVAEMARYGRARGARAETLMGLSGLGDLILTCSSAHSRNTSLGIALGEGRQLADILGGRRTVSEGVATARAVAAESLRRDLDLPVTRAVDQILHGGAGIDETIAGLLARPLKHEGE
ncbi:MAG: NAD(P)-dependent glycerol-3-phosphate dehydrogenase [Alphaproteobacteria bacterium]|jgi:glycerol-3-phosphate dehydrogenase (NAD(P)+)|nr:NAD(P)-dependent glycerol-3-phosphate dehydrogenase [Alphaproteobacteria bacterium]